MPFVTADHRLNPDPSIPGDRCYVAYRWMIDEWKKEPRWTTADRIYEKVLEMKDKAKSPGGHDIARAWELAFMVFFAWKMCDYEVNKEFENGEIE